MTFSEYLNECMNYAGCNARELSEASGLSQAVISRYRSGGRTPDLDSGQLRQIIHALAQLSQSQEYAMAGPDYDAKTPVHQGRILTEAELSEGFAKVLHDEPGSVYLDTDNLNAILISMDVNIKKLSQFISYDPSYISRIRSGQRKPSNPIAFARDVIQYLMENCDREKLLEITIKLMNKSDPVPESSAQLEDALNCLLIRHRSIGSDDLAGDTGQESPAVSFVQKLSEFDLDEYIRAIHFDTLHVPSAPIQLPTSKAYYGIEDMKQGELDFFRHTVLSRSKDPIYMCSDMDIADMAQDVEFGKKWMFAIATAIKKGLKLNIIHSLDRPFNEMMLGLESWIPLYMTGQVTSYYLTGPTDKVYSHLHYVSGAAALFGECIRGFHSSGRYYLTNNKREVLCYHRYCTQLFGKAKSLMVVFTKQNLERYRNFLSSASMVPGTTRLILSAPLLCAMSPDLLNRILSRCGKKQMAESILEGISSEYQLLSNILEHDRCEIDLSSISREEFEKYPVALSLAGVFPDENLYYTWEEYQEHLSATQAFLQSRPGCSLQITARPGFRNIRIYILKGRWVMISKNVSPAIHFVIRHPKLRAALENMVLPVVEP